MKKSLLFLLCLALVATACGGTAEETVEEPVAMEEVETLEAPATTVSDVFMYLKVVWVIASVDSATASNELLSDSSLAPYEQEINNIKNIGKNRFIT